MEVKCSKGFWNVKPETGEIFAGSGKDPIASAYQNDLDMDEYISNAAVMSQSANMYYLLRFINSVIQLVYGTSSNNEPKDKIWDYVEEQIAEIESNIQEIIAHKPSES